jgi:hypothetical protein
LTPALAGIVVASFSYTIPRDRTEEVAKVRLAEA